MSQFQFEETEATIELFDKEGKLIDTIVLPADELAMLEFEAKKANMPTEDFINVVIKEMLNLKVEEADSADVDS